MTETPPSTKPTRPQRAGLFGPSRTVGSTVPIEAVPLPWTINLFAVVAVVVAVAEFVGAALTQGSTSVWVHFLIDNNAKAKKPVKPYGTVQALNDLHTLRHSAFVVAAIYSAVLLLLAYTLRKTRMAGGARWALLIVIVLLKLPFLVIPASGPPAAVQAANVVIGVAAIALIVLLFVPPSTAYFRACRLAVTPPEIREQRGMQQSPLAGLFGRRPAPAQQRGAQPAATQAGVATAPAKPMSGKAKAKVRSDAEAVNRGAELARSRAKASKSRRTSEN